MDKVRFGRALGYGARHTAKAIFSAVDAARTPSDQPPAAAAAPRPISSQGASTPRPAPIQTPRPQRAVSANAKALGRSVFTPVARFSSVLWLQVTGSIFAVIALALGQALWLRRADLHLSPHDVLAERAYLLLGIFLLFLYFAVSSFVRAHRRERR